MRKLQQIATSTKKRNNLWSDIKSPEKLIQTLNSQNESVWFIHHYWETRQMLSHLISFHASRQFNSGNNNTLYSLFETVTFIEADFQQRLLKYYLTWCCNNSSHWEAITNALCHCNHVRNDIMTLETPEVASCSPKSSLDLSGVYSQVPPLQSINA